MEYSDWMNEVERLAKETKVDHLIGDDPYGFRDFYEEKLTPKQALSELVSNAQGGNTIYG